MNSFIFKMKFFIINLLSGFRLSGLNIENMGGNDLRFLEIYNTLKILPNNILKLMKDTNLRIVYSDDSIPVNNGKSSGYYNGLSNHIYLWDSGEKDLYWQIITTIHEIGHFVDFQAGMKNFHSLNNLDLHEIYDGEYTYFNKYTNAKYYQDNIAEYFAQSFAEYFLIKNFSKKCPDTAKNIKNIITNIG